LFGLHIVSSMAQKQSEAAQSIKMIFQQRCQMAGVPGELSIEVGDIVGIICEWTRWADLVVMYPADPPGTRLMSRFSSGSRNVIHRSCRPVLTVPSSASSPERVLLAFDNSGKAQEGLFVAAYLATQWQVSLTVLTVLEQPHYADMQDMAQAYLAEQGVIATFKTTTGQVAEAILNTAAEESSDLIIMGGYGVKPLREVVLGSKVDPVIRESRWPILICR
jgi:nucleotide-binding universal stress UspA family protein